MFSSDEKHSYESCKCLLYLLGVCLVVNLSKKLLKAQQALQGIQVMKTYSPYFLMTCCNNRVTTVKEVYFLFYFRPPYQFFVRYT